MSFETKTWVDRAVTYAGRRKLTNVDTEEEATFDVERDEGEVLEEGDKFDADNMNDLEDRIDTVITALTADNAIEEVQVVSDLPSETSDTTLYFVTGA